MSKNRRNDKGLTGKAQRKQVKRAHIAAAIATQNAWIEDVFCVHTDDQRYRHTLFATARCSVGKQRDAR